jgi:hypothetical protein
MKIKLSKAIDEKKLKMRDKFKYQSSIYIIASDDCLYNETHEANIRLSLTVLDWEIKIIDPEPEVLTAEEIVRNYYKNELTPHDTEINLVEAGAKYERIRFWKELRDKIEHQFSDKRHAIYQILEKLKPY